MNLVSEKIDERILRLLGLEDVFDIDYDTYLTLLKEAIVTGAKKLPQEELAVLANERKRIRGKKGRFKPKKITADKVATTKFLKPAKKTLALAPSSTTSQEEGGSFIEIKKTLDSILKTLGSKFKFDQKQADEDRKEKETEKRGKRESTLEGFKKGVVGIVATTKKILSPFQAIIDRIWKFVFFTLLGRAFTKFMDWMSDKENQNKFNSFIEFLTDHWPALAGLYILFGTSFGKLVRGLLKGVTRMIVALVMNIGKIKKFITKNKKLAFLGLALAPLASRELGNLLGENKETPESGLIPTTNRDLDQAKQSTDQAANTKVPKLNLGGMVPSFKMGGMNSFGGMDFSGGVPITGAGQDDTLIAAKTGEAILTEKDQQDIGQRYVDSTTGQPLNIPQYLAGRKPGNVSMGSLKFPGFGGGFFDGGVVSKFNNGGIVGMKGGGTVKPVRGENPRMTPPIPGDPNMGRGNTTYKPKPTFAETVARSKKRLINKQAEANTNINTSIAPWWQRINPLADNRPYHLRLPYRAPQDGMTGYNRSKWFELNKFRDDQRPVKPNSKGPKVRYAPYYQRPGVDSPLKLQGGGPIKENTGKNIAGATADRQLIAAQPGEFVIPKDSVDRLGTSFFEKLVAMSDSNSNAYLKKGKIGGPQITPYKTFGSGSGGTITLPPITQSAGGSRARSAGLGGGSEVPDFSATAPNNERAMNASIYGLVG